MRSLFYKKDLEMLLAQLKPHPQPKVLLEQYTITPEIASELLFTASCMHDDIYDKKVLELGCGTGRLSIGASILGATEVIGIDIDPIGIKIAKENQRKVCKLNNLHWIVTDVKNIFGRFDTAIQNPPFGVKRKGADRHFIMKALEVANVVYSLHKFDPKNRIFIKNLVEKNGGKITDLFHLKFKLPWMFPFHHKRIQIIPVDLYRVESSCQKICKI